MISSKQVTNLSISREIGEHTLTVSLFDRYNHLIFFYIQNQNLL